MSSLSIVDCPLFRVSIIQGSTVILIFFITNTNYCTMTGCLLAKSIHGSHYLHVKTNIHSATFVVLSHKTKVARST